MTQQDDITQRVLTDDELQALWDEACKDSPQAPGWNRHIRYGRAVVAALLSKSHVPTAIAKDKTVHVASCRAITGLPGCDCAPVADERATKGLNRIERRASDDGRQRDIDDLAVVRAALASAPVAGEAQHDTDSACAWQVWWNQNKSRFTTTRQASLAAFAAGKDWHNAAPQASAEDVRDTALSNLLWAASERDKGNRIRQFDQFMDEARAAISSNAAKQGSSR